jgi:hypothetical protein
MIAHPAPHYAARLTLAAAMVAIGLFALIFPDCFLGIGGYFKRSGDLSPEERERLNRVLTMRREAEGVSGANGRYLAVACFILAAAELVPAMPFVLPYALCCLALAFTTFLSYVQMRRATQRRVAPLVRRSALSALPLIAMAAMLCCFAVVLPFVVYSSERLSAIAVAASTLILGVIAWRIAVAPALLFGQDATFEYAVDQRLRNARATTIAMLACAPAVVFVAFAAPRLSPELAFYGNLAWPIVLIAFLVSLVVSMLPIFRRISFA